MQTNNFLKDVKGMLDTKDEEIRRLKYDRVALVKENQILKAEVQRLRREAEKKKWMDFLEKHGFGDGFVVKQG